jgi:hypothetical protein
VILIPLLIPFVMGCMVERPGTVILLEGGNEYKEGRCKGQLKQRVY